MDEDAVLIDRASAIGMPCIEPETLPNTMPGMTNNRKISDTIDCMIGAWKDAMLPPASRHGEVSGSSVSASSGMTCSRSTRLGSNATPTMPIIGAPQ